MACAYFKYVNTQRIKNGRTVIDMNEHKPQ